MKTSSCKAKGRLLQQLTATKLLESFPQFTGRDIQSVSMGTNGEDILMSQPAKNVLGITIECKNRAAFAVYKDYQQAQSHGDGEPVLVIKQNRSKPLAIVDLDYFIQLLRKAIVNENREKL